MFFFEIILTAVRGLWARWDYFSKGYKVVLFKLDFVDGV
jgi:hypothetical protein